MEFNWLKLTFGSIQGVEFTVVKTVTPPCIPCNCRCMAEKKSIFHDLNQIVILSQMAQKIHYERTN